jgi:CBS domain-containing protein
VTTELPAGVRRLFTDGFRVADVAGPLASFDAETPARTVAAILDRDGRGVAGVRRDGRVVGFVERAALADGPCGGGMTGFRPGTVLADSAPLSAAVRALAESPHAFVTAFGDVAGVVTRDDLQKPPGRMWLFGVVTMIELRYTRLIADECPGDSWREYLSAGRLAKAEELRAERNRRNRGVTLLDCLQLSDKGTVVAKCEAIRSRTIFASRRQAEDGIKLLEGLRNDLAHAQDIVTTDWEAIVQLSGHVDRALGEERSPADE